MLTTLFIVSAIGVAALITGKVIEVHSKRSLFPLNIVRKADPFVIQKQKQIKEIVNEKKQKSTGFIVEELPRQVRYFFLSIKMHIKQKYDDMAQSMRGVRTLHGTREASSFLRDIKEHKVQARGGVIVDESTPPLEENDKNSVL